MEEDKYGMVNVPRALWKLHGRQAFWLDLLLTYLLAVAVAIASLMFSAGRPLWEMLLLLILSLDIGGGVVSNFTRGTIAYYRKSAQSPFAFIWVHVVQAGALAGVFWEERVVVGSMAVLAMLFSSMVIRLHYTRFARQLSVFLFAMFMMALVFVPALPKEVFLLLALLGFKLIVGFSGNWKGRINDTRRSCDARSSSEGDQVI